jgi:HSP20 family molecular chaperone IbpA
LRATSRGNPSVALPEGTGDGEARAHHANGVLEVHIEKPQRSKPRRVPVITTVESGSTD